MKIVLAALNAKYVHSNLAVYNLQAYAKKQWNNECLSQQQLTKASEGTRQLDCRVPSIVVREYTINHNLDSILQAIYMEKAAVVAFSCYIWNVQEILTIAKELHKVSPATRIWLGGPEVSYDSATLLAKHSFVEGIMRGEGEQTFSELVQIWSSQAGEVCRCNGEEAMDCNYKDIKGITYRNAQGDICENVTRPLMSMDEVPFVYDKLSDFDNKILYYETSRGCPFSCSYCLSSIDKSVRFRSMELVEKELQFFLDHQVPQVKLIDRTFNCKKEHSLAIWRYITEHDNGVTNFHFEVSADLLGEEELSLFEQMRPGLMQLEIGLQSTNPDTIKEIRRTMNLERLKSNMLRTRQFGNIHQHLDLIAGLPYEDLDSFQKSFNEAYDMRPNQLQLGFLKVLKGSYMEEQIEAYGLQYQDSQPYEVLSTKWISYDELLQLKLVEEMVEVYYNSDQYEHVLAYLIPLFGSPYAFYEALGEYYQKAQLFGIGFKREARYEALRRFVEEHFGVGEYGHCEDVRLRKHQGDFNENNDRTKCDCQQNAAFSMNIFLSLLTYDYYLRENAKSRPGWSPVEPIEKSVYHEFFKNGGTKELRLDGAGYDSKVAARIMHLESIVAEALNWILEDEDTNSRVDIQKSKVGVTDIPIFEQENTIVYCLFDYNQRNSLSKDASVMIVSHL